MSLRFFQRLVLLSLAAFASTGVVRAAADIAPPKVREKVVANANRVVETRGVSTDLPSSLPNPFVGKEEEAAAETLVTEEPVAAPGLAADDLLAALAARIPSTGTVILGGEPILLLGQKRLKVGDTYAISFEGRTYEVSIAAVTSTSFTVKRGENIHTRPVHITASSTSTPTNRP
jgi:hypothetical protein